jgi:hypothetical protein
MKHSLGVALLLFSPFLSACSPDFDWQEVEVTLRTLPGKNGVALLLVEKGVDHLGDQAGAVNALREVLEGRRRMPPEGGFISLDCDKWLEENAEGPVTPLDSKKQQLAEFVKATHVQKAGLFLDEKGRLCLFQLWLFAKPESIVRMCNEASNEALVLQADLGKPFAPEFPWFDETSWNRGVARAREGGEWVRLDETGILLDFPITRECASRCLAALVQQEDIRKGYGVVLAASTSLEVEEDRTRIRFAPEASGWFHSLRYSSEREYDENLLAAVKASRLPMSSAPTLEAMDKALRVQK